jgi:tetratricopeptide (TPR) repeat protein
MSETVAARWEEYNEAGRRSVGLGQLAEAEELFRAAVREGEQLGADSPHLATSLNALGQLRLQAKDVAEAESCFTRALAIRQQTYGPDSHAIVPSLNNLSALHDAKGETDKAVELLKRSLDISEKALGGTHPEVTLALNNLAKLYFKRRDFSKADRVLLRLLETKRALGKDHPEVATVLGSLAKLRQAVGKHGPAEQLWRQALAIRERAFAPNDAILATTLENVADCCAAQEVKLGDAIALRERAIAIRETAMGSAHPSLAAARAKLDELRARPGAAAAMATNATPAPRSSQEVPSPLLSAEVPPYPATSPSAPSPGLPWIQVDAEPTGERPLAHLELMGTEPPSVAPPRRALDRTPAATPRPPLMPPQLPPMPMRGSTELVFTDSLAPEATPPQPRHPDRTARRAAPPSSPVRPPRPRTPPRAHAAAPRAPVRMPPTMTESDGGSKKALLVALVLVAIAGAGGWFAFIRKAPIPATLLAAPVTQGDPHSAAVPTVTRAPLAVTPSAVPAPDSAVTRNVAKQKPAVVRDSTPKLERDLAAPAISASVDVDAVTRGIEQATKAKIDSAEKPRLEIKPIFKKP